MALEHPAEHAASLSPVFSSLYKPEELFNAAFRLLPAALFLLPAPLFLLPAALRLLPAPLFLLQALGQITGTPLDQAFLFQFKNLFSGHDALHFRIGLNFVQLADDLKQQLVFNLLKSVPIVKPVRIACHLARLIKHGEQPFQPCASQPADSGDLHHVGVVRQLFQKLRRCRRTEDHLTTSQGIKVTASHKGGQWQPLVCHKPQQVNGYHRQRFRSRRTAPIHDFFERGVALRQVMAKPHYRVTRKGRFLQFDQHLSVTPLFVADHGAKIQSQEPGE